jgi:hypothetical protein
MVKLGKQFWRNFWITIIIIGTAYGITAFFALKERERKQEQSKIEAEKQRIREEQSLRWRDSVRHHNDSIANTIKGRKRVNFNFKNGEQEDDDKDSSDNPDFDDLIPGEEYDEEFVDRSKGDPELYH